ncbi:aldehyde ferredoxin oxidoreductase N-terminal domain-containing protein [Anaerosoma tenue]|uniref:aldehyde ferredoxin oxidoreductase N-terminal domain-containing protein n=1 Tax=Anaerosoma tenue TaxID=2933588 RepID=UPI002260D667|nr:aldehyde ferredoxin oxidoreductase N-terminal domain-containing protein [Anaerosoma tenue]MCK8114813.1 aldehyde ferredoxin oxidoreductase [Anaerosoma tenue]
MGNGYAGKILRVDLTAGTVSEIETEQYREWGGGHGMGSAIFWDLCADKTISGFDPANVITIMSSPLAGTLAPSASRLEIQGIGVQSTPEWFTRSNMGGRFATMMKFAGWDGIVLEGAASKPTWIEIENDRVVLRDAETDGLWGLDTYDTQERIWNLQVANSDGWREIGTKSGERAALQSAVITIGPSGEKKSRVGALIHDAGNAAAQGGFGGVWGAKNLKAISVIGSKDIDVADAAALLNARFSAREDLGVNVDEPKDGFGWARFSGNPSPAVMYPMPTDVGSRPQACQSCISSCRARFSDGLGNESSCEETYFYFFADMMYNQGQTTPTVRYSAEMVQRLGINVYEIDHGLNWLYHLYQEGIAGVGKQVDIDLPWDTYGSREFIETYQRMVADREGAGDILAEGMWRAAEHWGRLEEDTASGVLHYSYWGLPEHGYDPRAEAYWGWGSILGDRDINEHDFNNLFWKPSIAKWYGIPSWMEAEEFVTKFAERMLPFDPDPMMLDFSEDGMYSEGQVKLTAWHRHYTRFWKESALYCDYRFADFYSPKTEDRGGFTPEGEPLFWNAVTGDGMSFTDGMELGRRIWNLDNAIWTIQGRHRDMVKYSEYLYEVPYGGHLYGPYWMPTFEDGTWDYRLVTGRVIDRERMEDVKTMFYELEGWDVSTGWPTRETLEGVDLGHVADTLEAAGKLGGE